MTPSDETIDVLEKSRVNMSSLQQRRAANASLLLKQREAAEQWQADNKKNALLFPQSYDFF